MILCINKTIVFSEHHFIHQFNVILHLYSGLAMLQIQRHMDTTVKLILLLRYFCKVHTTWSPIINLLWTKLVPNSFKIWNQYAHTCLWKSLSSPKAESRIMNISCWKRTTKSNQCFLCSIGKWTSSQVWMDLAPRASWKHLWAIFCLMLKQLLSLIWIHIQ